jgi:hypothetical protein
VRPVSTAFLAAVTRSHTLATRVDVLQNGSTIVAGLSVTDGSVTIDRTADVRGRCSIVVADPALVPSDATDLLTPYGNELRVWRGVRFASTSTAIGASRDEMVSLGVFRIQSFTVDDPGRAIKIEGFDRSQAIREAAFEDVYIVPAGTLYTSAIQSLISAVLPATQFNFFDAEASAPLLVFDDVGEGGRWSAATSMAASLGCELYFDGDGSCVLRPDTSAIAASVLTVTDGVDGVIVAGSKGWARDGMYNAVVATSSNPTGALSARGFAYDSDPNSPTYYFGPFGKKIRHYASPFIATQAQAESAALSILQQSLGASQALKFTIAPNPALEPGDVITVQRGALGVNQTVVVDSVSVGLQASSAMEADVRILRGSGITLPVTPTPIPPVDPPTTDPNAPQLIYRNDFRTGLKEFTARSSGTGYPVTNGSVHLYRPQQVTTGSTGLIIEAAKVGAQWYSGLIDTRYGLDFIGPIRCRIRCRMSDATGMWPTLWWKPQPVSTASEAGAYGSWPSSGEWDVFEAISNGRFYWTIHGDNPLGSKTHWQLPASPNYTTGVDVTQWHIIESDWVPGVRFTWYLDGVKVKEVTSWPNMPIPYDKRFYPILNMAVGSNIAGFTPMPDGTTPLSGNLYEVDYFEVYSINPDAAYVPPVIPVDPTGGQDADGNRVGAVLTSVDTTGGVVIPAGTTDINAIVQANATGTKFVLLPGVTYNVTTSIVPKTGQIFVGQVDTAGKASVIDGGGTVDRAIRGNTGSGAGTGFTVRNIVFDHFTSSTLGAVTVGTTGSVLEYCEVRNTTGTTSTGVWSANAVTVQQCYIHHNAKYGIGGNGDGINVLNNEIAYNNLAHGFDGSQDAGGTKWAAGISNLLVSANYSHHNGGAGLWVDADGRLVTITGNKVWDNDFVGIDYEISWGPATISNNDVRRNGAYYLDPAHQSGSTGSPFYGSDISVNTSGGSLGNEIEIYGNTVETDHNGIALLAVSRGTSSTAPHSGETYTLTGVNVHHNDITISSGGNAAIAIVGLSAAITDPANTFQYNTYHTPNNASNYWLNGTATNLAGWQAAGRDINAGGSASGFETGTNGATISTANAGDPTAWNTVTINTGCTATYDTTHAHRGTLSGKLTQTATTSSQCYVQWSAATLGTRTNTYGRLYLWMNSASANGTDALVQVFDTTPTNAFQIQLIKTAGVDEYKLKIVDGPSTVTASGTVAVALGHWVRIEWHAIANATTGAVMVRLFNTPDGTTPSETITLTGGNTRANFGQARFGIITTNVNWTGWLDDIVASATYWPDPA